jgi:hypothetical protein
MPPAPTNVSDAKTAMRENVLVMVAVMLVTLLELYGLHCPVRGNLAARG